MKTLIVEPSRTYRLLLKEFLQSFNIDANEVANGASALKNLDDNHYDILCIAMHLPDMLGVDLANLIKSIKGFENTIVILLTSEKNQGILTKLKSVHVNYVCQKMELETLNTVFAQLTQDELISYDGNSRILYIEDQLSQAEVTIAILGEMGIIVDHFTNAESGLEAFETNHYDLVLTDIVLAGKKNGIDIIEDIRGRCDNKILTPILAISASISDSQRIRALKVGANDFITKPFIQAELAVRLKNMLITQHLYQQIIEQKKELEQMALTDQLTGLYNRHFLIPYVDKALSSAKRYNYPLSIVMIDLDKFKLINDELGHDMGDQLLRGIASILQLNCRNEDAAIRLGGDEFLIVLSHCSLEQARKKSETLRQSITQLPPSSHTTSASFGLSSTEEGMYTFDQLYSLADSATYQAKKNGGNDICH